MNIDRRDARPSPPAGYEEKFAGFVRACSHATANGISNILIARPEALGDTYDEIVESLWRIAEARLTLTIATPSSA